MSPVFKKCLQHLFQFKLQQLKMWLDRFRVHNIKENPKPNSETICHILI